MRVTSSIAPDLRLPAVSALPLSFAEACERTTQFDAGEHSDLQATGHTRLMTHGRPTERVAVLFHGITNNPQQWAAFGQQLHDEGWNILIPRLPYHGRKDLLTTLPGKLTVADMTRYATEAFDIARGLGERIAVVGLSAGGTYAAFAAQKFALDRAVIIAPMFGIYKVPVWLTPLVATLFRCWIPNQMCWWDAKSKMAHIPPHAYPVFSTRNLAQTLYLGEQILRKAQKTAPCCRDIFVINNAADHSISNAATDIVTREWKRHGARVDTTLFPANYNLPHDVIDVTQPKGQTPLVYARLREILLQDR